MAETSGTSLAPQKTRSARAERVFWGAKDVPEVSAIAAVLFGKCRRGLDGRILMRDKNLASCR